MKREREREGAGGGGERGRRRRRRGIRKERWEGGGGGTKGGGGVRRRGRDLPPVPSPASPACPSPAGLPLLWELEPAEIREHIYLPVLIIHIYNNTIYKN